MCSCIKYVNFQKNKWYIKKKKQSSFQVQTNNGYKPWKYSKRGRKRPPFLTAAILEFFVRPQVPASRDEKAANQPRTGVIFSRACPRAHVRLALAFARLKSAKKQPLFFRLLFKGIKVFANNTVSGSGIKNT